MAATDLCKWHDSSLGSPFMFGPTWLWFLKKYKLRLFNWLVSVKRRKESLLSWINRALILKSENSWCHHRGCHSLPYMGPPLLELQINGKRKKIYLQTETVLRPVSTQLPGIKRNVIIEVNWVQRTSPAPSGPQCGELGVCPKVFSGRLWCVHCDLSQIR